MPELPEVETVVRGLREPLVGHTLLEVWYDREAMIRTPAPAEFAARIAGQKVTGITRRAKYIVIQLEHDLLTVHLKMTGRLYVSDADYQDDADRWVRVKFKLDGGKELRFSDARRFGRVALSDQLEAITGSLGPEPLEDDFTADILRERLQGHRRIIKALLLDQTFVAGVGNIYADEALHRAKIHPLRPASTLTDAEIMALHATIRAALADGVEREGASINWYRKADGGKGSAQDQLYVYGRTGEPCLTCGHPIEKIRVAQRGTHFCPVCQPAVTT
jgi:formamidopyrimidine-DNA glycosylase